MPNPNKPKPDLLAYTTRNNGIETLHYGWVFVLNQDKNMLYKRGNPNDHVFLRSCAKPIQAIPLADRSIREDEMAVICGSHSGSKEHIKVLENFMRRFDLKVSDLKCGIHYPFDEKERNKLILEEERPCALHNNCSGKHLGMLYVCKQNKWNTKTYLTTNHPLQKLILNTISTLSETQDIKTGVDGCGVPTFALPAKNIAVIFSNFTKEKSFQGIVRSMKNYPYYMGSKGQIDSEIIVASDKKLISKVGAEGIIVVAFKGNCAIVKIADGSPRIRSFIILKLLEKLGWLSKKNIKDSILEEVSKGIIKNYAGTITGKIKSNL